MVVGVCHPLVVVLCWVCLSIIADCDELTPKWVNLGGGLVDFGDCRSVPVRITFRQRLAVQFPCLWHLRCKCHLRVFGCARQTLVPQSFGATSDCVHDCGLLFRPRLLSSMMPKLIGKIMNVCSVWQIRDASVLSSGQIWFCDRCCSSACLPILAFASALLGMAMQAKTKQCAKVDRRRKSFGRLARERRRLEQLQEDTSADDVRWYELSKAIDAINESIRKLLGFRGCREVCPMTF